MSMIKVIEELLSIRCGSQLRFHVSVSRFPRSGPTGSRSPLSAVLSRHYDFLTFVSRRLVAFAPRYHACIRFAPTSWNAWLAGLEF